MVCLIVITGCWLAYSFSLLEEEPPQQQQQQHRYNHHNHSILITPNLTLVSFTESFYLDHQMLSHMCVTSSSGEPATAIFHPLNHKVVHIVPNQLVQKESRYVHLDQWWDDILSQPVSFVYDDQSNMIVVYDYHVTIPSTDQRYVFPNHVPFSCHTFFSSSSNRIASTENHNPLHQHLSVQDEMQMELWQYYFLSPFSKLLEPGLVAMCPKTHTLFNPIRSPIEYNTLYQVAPSGCRVWYIMGDSKQDWVLFHNDMQEYYNHTYQYYSFPAKHIHEYPRYKQRQIQINRARSVSI